MRPRPALALTLALASPASAATLQGGAPTLWSADDVTRTISLRRLYHKSERGRLSSAVRELARVREHQPGYVQAAMF